MLATMLLVCMSLPASLAMTRLVDDQGDGVMEENPHTDSYLTYGEKRSVSYPPQDRYN